MLMFHLTATAGRLNDASFTRLMFSNKLHELFLSIPGMQNKPTNQFS